jgi:hypothetical protein
MAYKQGGKPVPHWRALINSKYLNHAALEGKDCAVTIREVRKLVPVVGEKGREDARSLLFFDGKEKPLIVGVKVCATIASLHGDDYTQWVGKKITIYPTIEEMQKGPTGCVRVRPKRPDAPKNGKAEPAREPGGEG